MTSSPARKRPSVSEDEPVNKSPSSKLSLTTEEIHSISKVLQDNITSGMSPRKKRVLALMKSNDVLSQSVHADIKIKKVVDRVRYLMQSRPTVDSFDLPVEDPGARTAQYVMSADPAPVPSSSGVPSSHSQSGRLELTNEDTIIIEKAIATFHKVPRKTELRSLFLSSDDFQRIWNENNFARI